MFPVIIFTLVYSLCVGATVASSPNQPPITICTTPGNGFWMYDTGMNDGGTADDLRKLISPNGGESWPFVEQGWNLTGYHPDILADLIKNAKLENVLIKMYPSYTAALYGAVKGNACDFAFASFTYTAEREYCGNETSPEGIAPCVEVSKQNSDLKSADACCADFSTPIDTSFLSVMVSNKPLHGTFFETLLNVNLLNNVCFLIVAIVVTAHFMWYAERNENEEQFPRRYLDGIDDAIWWATTTITTVGYGDKYPVTNMGRGIGLIWMILGLLVYATFSGTMADALSAASAKKSISSVSQLAVDAQVCTPSAFYHDLFLQKLDVKGYSHPDGLKGCLKDLKSGEATGVFYDDLVLRYYLGRNQEFQKGWKVLPTDISISLGPAFPTILSPPNPRSTHLRKTINRALLDYQVNHRTRHMEHQKKYFPQNIDGEAEAGNELNVGVFVVTMVFLILYPTSLVLDSYQPQIRKRLGLPPQSDTEATDVKGEELFTFQNPLSADEGQQGNKKKKMVTFSERDRELDAHHQHSLAAGKNKHLYADGPEFNGLVREIHAMHKLILQQQKEMADVTKTAAKTRRSIVMQNANSMNMRVKIVGREASLEQQGP